MKAESHKLSSVEKLGYGLGDSAANFIFQTMMILQLSFYTDTFGISAAAAGTLLLVARFWGAAFDPIMGVISDRTNTRWGKFRPWILWTAIPFGILGFLTFYTPNFSSGGKLIYAYVTYISLMMIYSANNLPYSALSGVITGDMVERTSLSSFRMNLATAATLSIQGLALPMVAYFGKGSSARGYATTMGIFCSLGVLFFFVTFLTTKERVKPDPQQKTSLKQDLANLAGNKPWIALFVLTVLIFTYLSMRFGTFIYYFKYCMDQQSMRTFLEGFDKILFGLLGWFGLVGKEVDIAGNTFSIFNVVCQLVTMGGILLSKPLAARFGKRNVFIAGLSLSAIFTVAFFFPSSTSVLLAFVIQIIYSFVYSLTIPLLWAMMADITDYSEWKTGRRSTGVFFAATIFGLKAGLAIGAALGGWFLSLYGYVPNVAQSAQAMQGIRLTVTLFPAIAFFSGVITLFFYKIDKHTEFQMQNELEERRKQFKYE